MVNRKKEEGQKSGQRESGKKAERRRQEPCFNGNNRFKKHHRRHMR